MALSRNPLPALFVGPGGATMTEDEIKQARALETRRAMQGVDTSPVGHWTQGAARVADAIAGAFRRGALDRAEQANQAFNDKEFGSLSDYLAGGGGAAYPESVAQGGSPTAPAALGENAPLIKAGLMERGIPEHIADGFVMNFQDESGLNPGINEANPTVAGSRGGYGLYQLTGPRRVAYEQFAKQRGVAPSDTNAQLDFLVSELKGPEANAAKSIFAAPDAGTAAAAIATNFLRPNEKSLRERVAKYTANNVAPVGFGDHGPTTQLPPEVRAQRLAANQAGMVNFTDAGVPQANPAYTGVQTASLDPSIGLPTQTRTGDVITVPPVGQVAGNNAGAVPIQGNPVTGTVTIPTEGASPAITTNPVATGVGVGGVPAGTGGGEPTLDWTSQPNLSLAANIPFDNSQVPGNMGTAIPPQAVAAAVKPTAVPASVQRVSRALPIRPMADPNDVMVADMAHTEQPQQPTGRGIGQGTDYYPPAPSMNAPAAPAAAQNGPNTALLVRAMTDPRASDKTRTIAKLIYEKQASAATFAQKQAADRANLIFQEELKRSDPKYAQDLQKGDLELEKMRHPTTNDMIEYNFAKTPEGGGFTGTFPEWVIANRKASAASQNVVVEGEKKQDQTIGEGLGKDLMTMIGEEKTARQTVSSLNAMEKEMNDPNFYSGAGANAVANMKRLAASMGIDPKSVKSTEAFNALSKKAVLDNMGGSLGTGVSNADRDYIEGQVPNINNTEPGNRQIIGLMRKINERKVKVAQLARTYAKAHNNRLDLNFYDELGTWADANPLFTPEERNAGAPAAQQGGGPNELHFDANGNLIQ